MFNVGAGGNVEFYSPDRHWWLHDQLQRAAEHVTGSGIHTESVCLAASHRFEITLANCEDVDLRRRVDLGVFRENLKHLDAPEMNLKNGMRHLVPSGKLLRRELDVYSDHIDTDLNLSSCDCLR